jgi:2,3-bisphosphoglycerate-independent phosphoglycerate mutase
VAAALDALSAESFAYVHLEAPDECGHLGRADLKVQAVEMFDARIVAPIWRELESRGEPYRLIATMDHRTPISVRGHTREPVPALVIDGPTGSVRAEADFDEISSESANLYIAHEWIAAQLRLKSV